MEKLIACCGLNCETCDARKATIQNSDELRKATAEKWQKMFNSPEITVESINCTGCRETGVKFSYCSACEIRNCARSKDYETCGECADMATCQIVAMVHKHMPEAITNLKELN
jgi:hypothetical protein